MWTQYGNSRTRKMAKTVTSELKSKPKKSWGIGVNFIQKVRT